MMTTLRMSAAFALVVTASASFAADCPDMGVTNDADQTRFCQDLMNILHAPHGSNTTRSVTPPQDLTPMAEKLIGDIPEFGEAYRTDPKKTLDLIRLIREAGGNPAPQ